MLVALAFKARENESTTRGCRTQLKIALAATAAVAVLELAGGIAAHSLALLSDAAHVTMDVVALIIALAASIQSARPANERQTFGFARLEILAGLGNSGLLLAVTVLIVVEAVHRFMQPELPDGTLMAIIAGVGLVVNVGIGIMLLRANHDSLNMRAAMLHVGGDALGGLAVIARRGRDRSRPARAGSTRRSRSSFRPSFCLGSSTSRARRWACCSSRRPATRSCRRCAASIVGCDGVVDVHDLHVWTIGTGSHALAAHVVLDDRRLSEATAVLNAHQRGDARRVRHRPRHDPVRMRILRGRRTRRLHASSESAVQREVRHGRPSFSPPLAPRSAASAARSPRLPRRRSAATRSATRSLAPASTRPRSST